MDGSHFLKEAKHIYLIPRPHIFSSHIHTIKHEKTHTHIQSQIAGVVRRQQQGKKTTPPSTSTSLGLSSSSRWVGWKRVDGGKRNKTQNRNIKIRKCSEKPDHVAGGRLLGGKKDDFIIVFFFLCFLLSFFFFCYLRTRASTSRLVSQVRFAHHASLPPYEVSVFLCWFTFLYFLPCVYVRGMGSIFYLHIFRFLVWVDWVFSYWDSQE